MNETTMTTPIRNMLEKGTRSRRGARSGYPARIHHLRHFLQRILRRRSRQMPEVQT